MVDKGRERVRTTEVAGKKEWYSDKRKDIRIEGENRKVKKAQ